MKKLLLMLVLCAMVCCLFACNDTEADRTCWTEMETITYKVSDADKEIGSLVTVLERNPADKSIDGTQYPGCTSKYTYTYNAGGTKIEVVALLNDFVPLASKKVYASADRNYNLKCVYEGKYCNYTLDENGSQKTDRIKVKSPFMDNELMYVYIRCKNPSSVNMTINVPSALADGSQALTVSNIGTDSIPLPAGVYNVNVVTVQKADAPVGQSIGLYYAADGHKETPEYVSSGMESTRYLVKIVENNLTYEMVSIKA